MGALNCLCFKHKSQHEILVDELFLSLPIRKLSIDKFNEIAQIQKGNQIRISNTAFQKICNKTCYVEENRLMLHSYWGKVFNKINKGRSSYILVFILYLLCKKEELKENVDRYLDFFDSNSESSNTNTETEELYSSPNKKHIKMVGMELREVMYSYFYSISYLTIEDFVELSNQKEKFKEFLTEGWNPIKIWRFTTNKFFEDKNNLTKQLDLKRFLAKNIDFLKNDCQIRKEIMDFSYKEACEGEEYLDLRKLINKN
jgi:hypothetical protein